MKQQRHSKVVHLALAMAAVCASSACGASAQNVYQPTQDEFDAALVRYYHTGDSPTTAAVVATKLNRCDPAEVGGVNGMVCSFCAVVVMQGAITVGDRSKSVMRIERRDGSVGMVRAYSAEQRAVGPPAGQRGVFIGIGSTWAFAAPSEWTIASDPVARSAGFQSYSGLEMQTHGYMLSDAVRDRIEGDPALRAKLAGLIEGC
jgi:hypothetical protein